MMARPRGRDGLAPDVHARFRLALGVAAGALVALSATPAASRELHCGTHILLEPVHATLPAGGLQRKTRQPGAVQNATFVLQAGTGLQAQPAALAAWQRAIAIWEGWLQDGVTITIAADLQVLTAGVLGETAPQTFLSDYTSIRDAVLADAASDEGILAALPDSAAIDLALSPGFSFGHQLSATKANLRALGFDMSFNPAPDATMTFNSTMLAEFDFDASDGIDPSKYDFEAIVVHEIGHVLGFMSEVDTVDLYAFLGFPTAVVPRTLDLLRFRPGAGAADFTGNPRVVADGQTETQQVLYDGFADLALSTGTFLGDGAQASHWKADDFTGVYIGIMDPTIAAGDREELTPNDIRAFGLIGWDVGTDCNGNGIPDAIDIRDGTSLDVDGDGRPDECFDDCNGNGIPDADDITSGFAQDCDANGVPDSCDIASGAVPDCNGNGVPDACDITAGTSADGNGNGIPDECEPFAFPAPRIDSILDVAADQGRAVRMRIAPSSLDVAGSPAPILQYEVFRRIDPLGSASTASKVSVGWARPRAAVAPPPGPGLLLAGWDFVISVPAHAESEYNVVLPTLADSTIQNGLRWSVFFVRAATSAPLQFYDSAPDSGYSVDNIAPEAPLQFTVAYGGAANQLAWAAADEPDFAFFRVYRDTDPVLAPDPAKLVYTTPATSWSDPEAGSASWHYALTTVDDAGNESAAAAPSTTTATNIPPPNRVQLFSNVPNPFNPTTSLRFALPQQGPVALEIFNAAGRLVRAWNWPALAAGYHSVLWDGRDRNGRRVASGAYIVRLQAGGTSLAHRMILLK